VILPISCEIASGTTACGDGYVIQDVKSEERRGTRQLVFTSNLRAVQSEIGYHIVGTKKRKKIFEFEYEMRLVYIVVPYSSQFIS
jgi:hypothetical protein